MSNTKISLGTAQWGLDYGIANTSGQVPKDEILAILDFARDAGIHHIDTAAAYGNSEAVIGECLEGSPGGFNIVSKLPPQGSGKFSDVTGQLSESLTRLKAKSIYGYLVHHFDDIRRNKGLWDQMRNLKKRGQVLKIGVSLYTTAELIALLDQNMPVDIVQVPFSIFDRRFEKYFGILKSKGIEVQARSVFLQGLAFLAPEKLPGHLAAAAPQLRYLRDAAGNHKMTIGQMCLDFVVSQKGIDRAVIGADRLDQIRDNVAGLGRLPKGEQWEGAQIVDEDILLPYNWNLAQKETV